jgi:hypothetical protein
VSERSLTEFVLGVVLSFGGSYNDIWGSNDCWTGCVSESMMETKTIGVTKSGVTTVVDDLGVADGRKGEEDLEVDSIDFLCFINFMDTYDCLHDYGMSAQ